MLYIILCHILATHNEKLIRLLPTQNTFYNKSSLVINKKLIAKKYFFVTTYSGFLS